MYTTSLNWLTTREQLQLESSDLYGLGNNFLDERILIVDTDALWSLYFLPLDLNCDLSWLQSRIFGRDCQEHETQQEEIEMVTYKYKETLHVEIINWGLSVNAGTPL